MDLTSIFDEVKSFIIANKLIMYGGMAVDYALKHKGLPGIYSDDEIPDYDFYTHKMEMAYELCNILASKGYENMNVINAYHPQTLRVRFGKVVVADISFMPKFVFDVIPTVNYINTKTNPKGDLFRVIHPKFKMADSHKAFISPTRGIPNEAIFHRFKKDMFRFNLLDEAYPDNEILEVEKIKIPYKPNKEFILGGLEAYILIVIEFEKLNVKCDYIHFKRESNFVELEKLENVNPIYIVDNVDILNLEDPEFRAPFMDDLLPRSVITKDATYYEYASTINFHVVDKYKIINIHGLMLDFLTKSFMAKSYKKSPYYQYYISLKNIIKAVQEPFAKGKIGKDAPFFVNMNLSTEKEPPEYLIKIHQAYNRKHQIKTSCWPLPTYYNKTGDQPVPEIQDHILLKVGYERLNNFKPYRELLNYGDVF